MLKRRLLPRGDRVLVSRRVESESEGGIYIPETTREKPIVGVVVEVGPEAHNLMPGMVVVFGQHAGCEVRINRLEYLFLRAGEIIGEMLEEEVPDEMDRRTPPGF